MQRHSACIVGTGFMAQAHVEGLRRAGVRVAGILGSTPQKSRVAAESLEIDRAFENYEAVLASPDVTSVHIVTPNRWHFEMARKALLAGKHVMCEKPLAMTTRESAELVSIAASHPHLAAAVNYNIRFYPLCIEARERYQKGELGDVLHVCGSYSQDWLLFQHDYNWRVLADEGGQLRAVADIGTHWLDLVYSITGLTITAVCADLHTVHTHRLRPRGEIATFAGPAADLSDREPVEVSTDDFGSIMLRFANGARGVVWVSQVMAGRKNALHFELAGLKSSMVWNSERPNELWIGHRSAPNQLLIRDPSIATPAAASAMSYPGGHNEGYADTFKQCFRSFYRSISDGSFRSAPPFATFADGHREITLCEAVQKSHQTSSWVNITG